MRETLPLFLSLFFVLPHLRPRVPLQRAALAALGSLPPVANSTLIHKVGNTTLWARSLVVLSTLWMTALYIQSSFAVACPVPPPPSPPLHSHSLHERPGTLTNQPRIIKKKHRQTDTLSLAAGVNTLQWSSTTRRVPSS